MESKTASKETIEKLIMNIELSINSLYATIKGELAVRELMDGTTPELYVKTQDLQIGIQLVLMDLGVSCRAAFQTENTFEKRFHLKNLLASISEGYKLLMNFGKQRKHSLWMLMEGDINKTGRAELIGDYGRITDALVLFGDTEINQTLRDLTLHYDDKMIKVYDMTVALNSEDAVMKKVCKSFDVVQKMLQFSNSVDAYVKANTGLNKPELDHPVTLSVNRNHSAMKHLIDKNGELEAMFKTVLPDATDGLDKMATNNTRLGRVHEFIEKEAPAVGALPELNNLDVLANNEMLLRFMMLDLVSIVDAYLHSSSDIEYALNFRRVMVTKASTMVHLYGYNNKEKANSVWSSIKTFVSDGDRKLKDKENEIEVLLGKVAANTFDKDLRAVFVHLFDNSKHCGNIAEVVKSVENLDPAKQVVEVMLMLEIYKGVKTFTDTLMIVLAEDAHEKDVQSTKNLMDMIDEQSRKIEESLLPNDVKTSLKEAVEKMRKVIK
jgi:hypothetical protein